jgi:hypothetical protein
MPQEQGKYSLNTDSAMDSLIKLLRQQRKEIRKMEKHM